MATTSSSPYSQPVRKDTVEQLRSFCRGEMAAVETYVTALSNGSLGPFVETLRRCMASHQERARLLGEQVIQLGGKIPEGAGPWGALVDSIEHVATALGAGPALAILEEGEEHGLRDYRQDLSKLDPPARALVEQRILPAQLETRRAIQSLRHSIT